MTRPTRRGLLPLLASTAILTVGCPPQTGGVAQGSITGSVIKGPVSGAAVTAFAVDDNGRRGDELGTAEADDAGAFTLSVGPHSGPTLVCATGGIYTEEATGGLVQLGTNELCSLVDDHTLGGTSTVILTPATNLHASLTACFRTAGRDANVAAASQHAALRLNDFFAAGVPGYDLRTTVPADPTVTLAASLTAEAWAGILLAGLSESAKGYAIASGLDPGVRVTAATLSTALAQDIDDGACLFDGQTATARLVQGTVELTEDALRGSPQGLATSILRFLESERNASGIAPDNVRDLVQRMQAHTSEIFGGGGGGADIDAPTVAYSEPEAGSTRGGNVRVTVRATDVSRIVEFVFTQPAQATFTSSVFVCTDDTSTDCTLTGIINTSAAPITDGPLTVTTRATDAAGNSTTQDLAFVVNNTLPQISVQVPRSADPPEAVQGVVEITATATDGDGISTLTVSIPGLGLCDDQPTSPCRDLEPATDQLRVRWDTATMPEGNITLTFEAVDGAGQRNDTTVTVEVDNNDIGAVTGVVDLGAPVRGATVTALVWTGRQRGAVLGTAVTNDQGQYRVNLDDRAHASVLVVVTGGSYTDVATSLTLQMNAGHELTSSAGAIQPGEIREVNVNPWTTLAASRARHTPVVQDDAFAIAENLRLLSQHLRRPTGVFDASRVRSIDLTSEVTTTASERAVLALSHAGLSRMAAELSIDAGSVPGTVTMTDLVRVLAQDLEVDPLLDGIGPSGNPVVVGPLDAPLSAATTRFDLAAAIDRFVTEAPFVGGPFPGVTERRNNSSINRAQCLSGRIYSDIAEDAREALYPLGQPAAPFDTTPPSIALRFVGAHNGRSFGDAVNGLVTVRGDATDEESSITRFVAILEPQGAPLADADATTANDEFQVTLGTDVLPNGAAAVDACPAADRSVDALGTDDLVCVCALATDEQDNVGEEIHCFARPAPTVTIAQPPEGTTFSATQAVVVDGIVTSGFDLADCAAVAEAPGQPSRTLATVLGSTTCDIDAALSGLGDANWTIEIDASDVAGRLARATRTFRVDATPPTVTITAPASGSVLATRSFQAAGQVTSTNDLATVTVRLSQASLVEERVLSLAPNATTWSTTLTDPCRVCVDGQYTVAVFATDIAGNIGPTQTTVVVVDTTPPSLALGASQPPVVNYAPNQPLTRGGPFSCPATGPCIDKREFRVAASAERIASSQVFTADPNPPRLVTRWANMLASTDDAPELLMAASDQSSMTVTFSIAETCIEPTLVNAQQVDANTFRIVMVASNMSVAPARLATLKAANLCLSVRATDVAGNTSPTITRRFKWTTVAPPLPVTALQTNLTTTSLTWPTGVRDVATFRNFEADDLLLGTVGTYVAAHAYVHNPYSVPVIARVSPQAPLNAIKLAVNGRRIETWSTESIPRIKDNRTASTTFPLNHPKNTATTSPQAFAPFSWNFVSPSAYANQRVFRVTQLSSPQLGLISSASISTQRSSAARPTSSSSSVSADGSTLTLFPRVFSTTAGGAPLAAVSAIDANGFFTIQPGETFVVAFESSNPIQIPNEPFNNQNAAALIDAAATPAFLTSEPGTPSLLTPNSPNSAFFNSVIYLRRIGGVDATPQVQVWSTTARAAPLACQDSECALGKTWTHLESAQVVTRSTVPLTMTTFVTSATDASTWSTEDAFPSVLRTVTAPTPLIVINP